MIQHVICNWRHDFNGDALDQLLVGVIVVSQRQTHLSNSSHVGDEYEFVEGDYQWIKSLH